MSGWKKPMAMNVIIANTLIPSGIPKGSPLSMPLNAWLFALIRMFAGNDIIVPIMLIIINVINTTIKMCPMWRNPLL